MYSDRWRHSTPAKPELMRNLLDVVCRFHVIRNNTTSHTETALHACIGAGPQDVIHTDKILQNEKQTKSDNTKHRCFDVVFYVC